MLDVASWVTIGCPLGVEFLDSSSQNAPRIPQREFWEFGSHIQTCRHCHFATWKWPGSPSLHQILGIRFLLQCLLGMVDSIECVLK